MYVCQRPEVNLQYMFCYSPLCSYSFIHPFLNLRNNFISGRLYIPTAAGRREQGGEDEVAMPSKSGMEVRSEKDGKHSYTPGLDLPHQVAWAVKIYKPRPPASSFR